MYLIKIVSANAKPDFLATQFQHDSSEAVFSKMKCVFGVCLECLEHAECIEALWRSRLSSCNGLKSLYGHFNTFILSETGSLFESFVTILNPS